MPAGEAVPGCEGPGDTNGVGIASDLGAGPSTGAASQEGVCQVRHNESEGSEEQRGQDAHIFSPKCPPGGLSPERLFQNRSFTRCLPSNHKDTARKWTRWDSC